MALIKCKECDKEISKEAKSCPNCGSPVKPKTSKLTKFIAGYIFLSLILVGIFGNSDDSKPNIKVANAKPAASVQPKKTAEQIKLEEAQCKKDLQCWGGKHSVGASVRCPKYIERLAKYSYEWTDGFLETKFSHFRWKNKKKGQLTVIGDKIKFQNGFGAFQNYRYECDYDPATSTVLDVRAAPGRV